jgi:hypothetical protein
MTTMLADALPRAERRDFARMSSPQSRLEARPKLCPRIRRPAYRHGRRG